MNRNLLIIGLLALVALGVWSIVRVPVMALATLANTPTLGPTETPGPPTPCAACVQAALASLAQEEANLHARQTQAPVPVIVSNSHALVTSIAAEATRSAAQTPAMFKANLLWNQAANPPYLWQADTLATARAADLAERGGPIMAAHEQARPQLRLCPKIT